MSSGCAVVCSRHRRHHLLLIMAREVGGFAPTRAGRFEHSSMIYEHLLVLSTIAPSRIGFKKAWAAGECTSKDGRKSTSGADGRPSTSKQRFVPRPLTLTLDITRSKSRPHFWFRARFASISATTPRASGSGQSLLRLQNLDLSPLTLVPAMALCCGRKAGHPLRAVNGKQDGQVTLTSKPTLPALAAAHALEANDALLSPESAVLCRDIKV
jgi:hypothetical protein